MSDLRDQVAEVLRDHVSHGGAGGNLWNADCLAVDCDWRDSGRGDMSFALRAHRTHLADVIVALTEEETP